MYAFPGKKTLNWMGNKLALYVWV